MKEVIQEMLKTEDQARGLVAESEQEAGRIESAARDEIAAEDSRARTEMHDQASGIVSEAETRARKEHDEELAKALKEAREATERLSGSVGPAVEHVVRLLTGLDAGH